MGEMIELKVAKVIEARVGWKELGTSRSVRFLFEGMSQAQTESTMLYRPVISVRDRVRNIMTKQGLSLDEALEQVAPGGEWKGREHVGVRASGVVVKEVPLTFDLEKWQKAGYPEKDWPLAARVLGNALENFGATMMREQILTICAAAGKDPCEVGLEMDGMEEWYAENEVEMSVE